MHGDFLTFGVYSYYRMLEERALLLRRTPKRISGSPSYTCRNLA